MTVSSPKRSSLIQGSTMFTILLVLCLTSSATAQNYSSDYSTYLMFHWKGALTSSSLTLKVFPSTSDTAVAANYNTFVGVYTKSSSDSTTLDNTNVIQVTYTDATGGSKTYPVGTVVLSDLAANTLYYYSFIFTSASSVSAQDFQTQYTASQPQEFQFSTTAATLTAYSFKFGLSSSAQTNSTSSVFTSMMSENMNFFIHTGNMFYADITTADTSAFYNAYYNVFSSSTQNPFFQSTPLVYVWDEHDYGTTDSNGKSASKPSALEAYNNFVPSVPVRTAIASTDSSSTVNNSTATFAPYTASSVKSGIFQSFIVGRCYFIILDLRSFKDITAGDILGSDQMNWVQNQFIFIKDNAAIQQVFVVSSIPWIHKVAETEWSKYVPTQQKIGQLAQSLDKTKVKVMFLCGDAPMVAFDDGSNNAFGNFPVVQAGSLDQDPDCKGGPYSHGIFTGRGQYGVLDVTDTGSNICVQVNLTRLGGSLISYNTCQPVAGQSPAAMCPVNQATNVKDTGFPWLAVIVGVVLALIIGFLLRTAYVRYQQKKAFDAEEGDVDGNSYLEMQNKDTRKKNEQTNLL